MYDALDREPTSGRRVGSRRRVRWLGANVGPMYRRGRRVRTTVGSRRQADASAPTSCTMVGADVGSMHRHRRRVRWLEANVGPTHGCRKVTHHNVANLL